MVLDWLTSLRMVLQRRRRQPTHLAGADSKLKQLRQRDLKFETLEERRLLSATPFDTPMAGDGTGDGADELFVPNPGVDRVGILDVGNLSAAFGVPQRNNVPGFQAGVTGFFDARYSDSPNPYSGGPDDHWTLASAITVADFDNDDLADLAIGVPGQNAQAGQVRVIYSSRVNSQNNEEIWSQDSVFGGVAVADQSEPVDRFGAALIAGDFDGNGVADLAIGAPLENLESTTKDTVFNAGAVHVVYARTSVGFGLDPGVGSSIPDNQFLTVDNTGGADSAGEEDRFGSAFAVGRFNNDSFDDLAIGVPGRTVNGQAEAGAVFVVYGSSSGLDLSSTQRLDQTLAGEFAETGDRFGTALTVGDFDNDGRDDLAVGVPLEDVGNVVDAGMVHIFFGTAQGLSVSNTRTLTDGTGEAGDYYGAALASGDYDPDARDDLAVGVPGEDITSGGTNLRDSGKALVYLNNSTSSPRVLTLGDFNFAGSFQANAYFGATLWTGNFDGGELIVPIPPAPNPTPTQQDYEFTGLLEQNPTSEPTPPPPVPPVNLPSRDFFDDLVVGIPLYDEPGSLDAGFDAGAVQIFFGSSSGPLENIGQHITLDGIETRRSPGGSVTVEDLRGTPTRGENFGGGAEYPYFTPQRMIAPLSGTPGDDWAITGFMDLDVTTDVANFRGTADRVSDGSTGTSYRVSNPNGAILRAPTNATVTGVALSSGDLPSNTLPLTIIELDFGDGWTGRLSNFGGVISVASGDELSAGDSMGTLSAGDSVRFDLKYQSYDGSPTTVPVDPFLAPYKFFAEPQVTTPGDGGGGVSNALDSVNQTYVFNPHEFATSPANKSQDCLIEDVHQDAGWMSVQLHSGEYAETVTDLEIPGRGFNWKFERTYRSGANFETALGQSWDFADNRRIVEAGADNIDRLRLTYASIEAGDVVRLDGKGRMDLYELQADGTFRSPGEFYTRLEKLADGTFRERDEQGSVAVYDAVNSVGVGRVLSLSDRNDNSLRYEYDEHGRLDRVLDTMGRVIRYAYADDGLITHIEDFAGRQVRFEYDANRDLVAVTSPVVEGTSTWNDFLDGRTTRYVYSSGNSNERLNHNLLQIIRPNEVAVGALDGNFTPTITLTYGADDRVDSQTVGGTNANGVEAGGTITYDYSTTNAPRPNDATVVFHTLEVNDRAGNLTRYEFNTLGNILRIEEFTNRDVRPGDDESFITKFEYNTDGELLRKINPEGDFITTAFASTDDRFQAGNAVRTEHHRGQRSGDQDVLITERGFEPIYNQVRSVTDARAFDPEHEAPIVVDGLDNADRYTTEWFYDYQESDQQFLDALLSGAAEFSTLLTVDQSVLTTEVLLVRELGLSEDAIGLQTLRDRLSEAGVQLGLGDLNADGTTDAVVAGNVVRIEYPDVHLLVGSNQAAVEGDRTQEIVELFRYNRFGQLTSQVDQEGNLTTYEYYAEQNPNSLNDGVDNADGAADTGGYLRRVVVDANPNESRDVLDPAGANGDGPDPSAQPLDPTRNSGSGAASTHIQGHFEYDSVGNVIRSVDGRGVVTEFEVNALNEVVVVTTAADHGFYAPGVFDAEEPLELENFAYQRRLFRDYNGNVVLEQAEDRGNTSHTDGNVPTADLSRHFFLERSRSTGNNALRLLGDDNQDWEINQWNGLLVRIEDGTGAGQVRTIVGNTSNMLFLDERWDDVPDETSVYVILPNPDAEGGTAYADTAFEYDILDNRIETVREVNHDANHYVRTSDRYDRNENRVLTILPEGNAISSIYDERDLLFQTSRGVVEAPDSALMAADDPVSFDVRGGELCQCSTFYVDGNRNVIAIVDSDDTDRDASNNMRISATQSSRVGDAVRLNYDGFDRLIFTTDAMGNQTRNTYDAAGNVTRVIRDGDPVNDNNSTSDNVTLAVTEFVHDELNRTVVQQQVLFETPDVITQRDVELTDTEAMDQFLSQSLVDDLLDAATVPGAIGLQNGRILGRVSHLTEYDRKSRVTFTVEDDLVTNRREYDGADRVIKTTDSALANGFSLTPATEDSPAVAAFDPTQLAGNTVERAYDDNNNVVEHLETDVTDVLLSSGPEQFRTTYYYDSLNRLQTRVNNIGQAMDHRYDSRNNRVATADAQGPTVLFGKPRAVHRRGLRSTDRIDDVNYFGNVTLYTYDGLNRQTMTEQLLTRRGFGDGFNIGATLEGVRSHRPNVDASQGGGDGIIRTATTYDDNSNVSARIDDNGNVSLRLYDNLDRKITETEGLNVRSQLSEDLILGDRVVPVNTAATISNTSTGISEAKIEAQLAEAASRLDVIEPLFVRPADRVDDQPPTTVVYGYTPDSNVQYIEDENDTEIFTQYDANNRAVAVRVYRAGQLDRHNDDPVFDPNPSSDFANHTDPDNPPVVIGTTRQNFTYDGLNRRTSATDNNNPGSVADDSRLTSAYDSLSRVVEQTQQTGTRDVRVITSDWNANDRRSGLTYSNGRELSFAYDTLDRLKAISDVPGPDDPPRIAVPLVHYDYIGTDRVLERAHQNGTQTSMLGPIGIVPGRDDVGYDGLRRVVQMRQVSGHNFDFAGTTRTYDRENNVTSEGKTHDVDNSETYRYDSAYRLTGLDRGLPDGADPSASEGDTRQPQDSRWTLDGAGNWQSVDGETRQHTSFNEVATRTSGGTTTALAYDDNGNLLEDGEHSYEYDFRNRLVRVTDAGGNEVARYAYDANNRRSLSVVSNSGELDGTTEFIYDGARAIEERNGDQTLRNQYVYGNRIDEVVVLDRNLDADDSAVGLNDQRLFYHSNPLGSVIALTNASGNVVEGYDYDAYGRVTVFTAGENGVVDFGGDDVIAVDGVSELDNPYLFTGRRLDAETGLYYYRNRYFDAGLGRFIQRDPIGTWGDPLALGNAYVYAAGRPVTATDPLGLFLSLEYNMLLGGSFLLATSGSTSCDGNGSIINASYDVSSAIGALSQHYVLDLAAVGPPIANAADSNYPGVTGLHGCGPGGSCGVPVTRVYTDYSRTSIGVVDQSYTYSPMGASEQGRELSDVEVVCHYELHWILFFPYRIWICEEFEIPEERPLEIPYNPGPPPAGHAGDEKYPQVNDVHVVPPVSSLLVLELLL